jgi:hypothetical protein
MQVHLGRPSPRHAAQPTIPRAQRRPGAGGNHGRRRLTAVGIWQGRNRLKQVRSWGEASLGGSLELPKRWAGDGSDEWKTMGWHHGNRVRAPWTDFARSFRLASWSGHVTPAADDGSTSAYASTSPMPSFASAGQRAGTGGSRHEHSVFECDERDHSPWLERLSTRHLYAAGGAFLNVSQQNIWYGAARTQWI